MSDATSGSSTAAQSKDEELVDFPDMTASMVGGRLQSKSASSSRSRLDKVTESEYDEEDDDDDDEDEDDLYADDTENKPLLPATPKRSRSERLLETTYGSAPMTRETQRSRRRVLRQVEKDVQNQERKEKNNLLKAMFQAQQISAKEAKGAFTPNEQMFGTTTVNDPSESTFCLVLAKTRHWRSRYFEVKALHAMIINQLTISGLRCVILPESPFVKDAGVVLIGIKATTQQLQREYEHKETENSVRVMSLGHSQDLRTALPNSQKKTEDDKLQISPAEEILLTQRIIHRSLEILRVHQGEKEKYIVNGVSCLQCLKRSFSCWLGCIPGQRYDPYVDVEEVENELKARKKKLRSFRSVGADVCADDSDSDDDEETVRLKRLLTREPLTISGKSGSSDNVIRQVFALHNRDVNHKLWRLFLKELGCGLCCKVTKFDHYPLLRFCDEVRYHYGNEVAVFFAFAAHTLLHLFILSLVCIPVAVAVVAYKVPEFDAISRGVLGLGILLIWGPIYLRTWDREYAVLVVRWSLDDGNQLYENPHDASFEWVYDERLHRRLREYDTACRPFVKVLFLPLAFVFLLLAMVDQTLFALWGAHQMTLPPCEECREMMDIVLAGPEAYYATFPRPEMAYDKFWYGPESTFVQNRTFEEFAYGWLNTNNASLENDCLPTVCEQQTIWWGTCWDAPDGLLPATDDNEGQGVGSPFIPFIMLTVLLMRPISSIFQAIYEALIRALTKMENWSTLEKYNAHYTQRRFLAYFLDVFWFNIIVVFILVRFGPAIMHQELEICTSTIYRGVPNADNNTVERLEITPYSQDDDRYFATGSFVDLWYQIPFNEYDLSLGIWYPANVLITGEWVGLVFDLVLLRLNFLNMIFWCGFFPAMILKCQRCRRRRCCRKAQDRSTCLRRFCCTDDLATEDLSVDGYGDGALEQAKIMEKKLSSKQLTTQSNNGHSTPTQQKGVRVQSAPSETNTLSVDTRQNASATNAAGKRGATSTPSKPKAVTNLNVVSDSDSAAPTPEAKFKKSTGGPKIASQMSGDLAQKLAATAAMAADLRKRRATTTQWQIVQRTTKRGSGSKIHPETSPPSSNDLGQSINDLEMQASMDLLSQIGMVTHLRGFDQDELLRIANLNGLHDCDGAISYLKVISHAATVMIFSIFFPLLVPIVFLGLGADIVAEVVGMLSASKYTVLPHTGSKSVNAWRWTLTVSQFAAIPLVFSYFAFNILEILECQNPKTYGDGTTGDSLNVGQTYCFDANYNNWGFNHSPYAVAWLALSFVSFIWVQMLLSLMGRTPAIVTQERKMRDMISQSGSENDELSHGLSVAQVPQLRIIYDHADEMLRMPGQGVPGDGEVPLDNIKRAISTLMNFHRSSSNKITTAQRSRTSVFRRENEAYNLLYGKGDSLSKEESRMLMATTLLFDPDSSGTTQFVEFTLGIRNLRKNSGQLSLFHLDVDTLDKNIAAYAKMLEDLKDDDPVAAVPDASRKSSQLLKKEYRRLSIQHNLHDWKDNSKDAVKELNELMDDFGVSQPKRQSSSASRVPKQNSSSSLGSLAEVDESGEDEAAAAASKEKRESMDKFPLAGPRTSTPRTDASGDTVGKLERRQRKNRNARSEGKTAKEAPSPMVRRQTYDFPPAPE